MTFSNNESCSFSLELKECRAMKEVGNSSLQSRFILIMRGNTGICETIATWNGARTTCKIIK